MRYEVCLSNFNAEEIELHWLRKRVYPFITYNFIKKSNYNYQIKLQLFYQIK